MKMFCAVVPWPLPSTMGTRIIYTTQCPSSSRNRFQPPYSVSGPSARLGWGPTVGFPELVREMVWSDLAEAQRDGLCRQGGFRVMGNGE